MKLRHATWLLLSLSACGPLSVPMPSRLGPAEQQRIERGWNKALIPVDAFDRRTWLDLLVGEGLFEEGVDKLYFRSEKNVPRGTVVMQIRFDREKPAADRSTMEIRSPEGKLVRREEYSRADVMQAARALFQHDAVESDPVRAERKQRWATLHRYFPDKGDGDAGTARNPDTSPDRH